MQLQMLFGNRIHPISLLLHHCLSLSVQFWQRLRCQFGSQQQDLFPPVQQCLAGIEIWPKSYACNCQTPGAFDRFFMPFDVTFEKIQSENGNYWNSAAAQELSQPGQQYKHESKFLKDSSNLTKHLSTICQCIYYSILCLYLLALYSTQRVESQLSGDCWSGVGLM